MFVQHIGSARGVTDTQQRGQGRMCHHCFVMAGKEPSEFPQVC